jgi:DNA polymerase V
MLTNQPIQFLGYVQAGFPSPAGDYMEDRINLDKALIKHPTATFLFQIKGESMIGAFIPPSCRVIVDRLVKPKNGSIVLAVVDGEFTVKRLVIRGAARQLQPENPKYKPIVLTEDLQFEIWGVVTYIITDAKEV